MALPLSNKVIAVTGAASGIALAPSKIPFERGASLSLADLQKERLDAAVATITVGLKDVESRILTTATSGQVTPSTNGSKRQLRSLDASMERQTLRGWLVLILGKPRRR
jgi:NADP-dependent 3-hydroxy acid dehydrogenase YdfG